MNSSESSRDARDPLDRAVDALGSMDMPEGPSGALIARTRSTLSDEGRSATDTPSNRRRIMLVLIQVAAAASIVAATTLSLWAPGRNAEACFEAVTRKLQEARTLSFRQTQRTLMEADPEASRTVVSRVRVKDPGLIRIEANTKPEGLGEADPPESSRDYVSIIDFDRGRMLTLFGPLKEALIQEIPRDGLGDPISYASKTITSLRSLVEEQGEPIDGREIGGIAALGFRVTQDDLTWDVWIDPDRQIPLLMETSIDQGASKATITLDDFRIDPPLDDALFQLDVPEDYRLLDPRAPIVLGEKALANLLRFYAERSDGTFPTRLDDGLASEFNGPQFKDIPTAETFALVQALAGTILFLTKELDGQYTYLPRNAKLGDAEAIIFRYQPAGATTARALFADLHFEEIPVDRSPE